MHVSTKLYCIVCDCCLAQHQHVYYISSMMSDCRVCSISRHGKSSVSYWYINLFILHFEHLNAYTIENKLLL